MEHHDAQVRVRYAETDQMGIVYHANYLVWMEVGRIEYCRAKGVRYRDMEERDGILLSVVEAHCRYASPARYDDDVIIRTSIGDANPRLLRFDYEMLDAGTGAVRASGYTRHVYLNREFRPVKLPVQYRPLFGITG